MTEKDLIFCCCCCGLPRYKPENADRITHGIHIKCIEIYYPEQYEEMEKSDGNALEKRRQVTLRGND